MITLIGKFLFERQLNNTFRLMPNAFSTNPMENIIPKQVLEARKPDMPVEMANPYEKPRLQCVLCRYNVKVDYKNVRLLSQFISPFSGRVYGRHISGLCEKQQNIIEKAIKLSQTSGLMPYYFKELKYMRDPGLFNFERPFKSHRF